MNADIVSPFNRLSLAKGSKVTALHYEDEKLFIGLSNGSLQIMKLSGEAGSLKSPSRSLRSFQSFTDIKGLFHDNDLSLWYNTEKSFTGITPSLSPITTLLLIPLYKDGSRDVLVVGSSEVLRLYEWVGSHLNMIHSFDDAKSYSTYEYIELPDFKVFLIGTKKRLCIYSIRQKSRNIFDFKLHKELHLKDRIRAINYYSNVNMAVLGLSNSFVRVDLSNDFSLHDLQSLDLNMSRIPQAPSFSYFGLSTSTPYVDIIDFQKSSSLFIRDLQAGILCSHEDGFSLGSSNIKLTATPLKAAFVSPCYVILLFSKKFQIVDIKSGNLLQTFNHHLGSSSIALTVFKNVLVIGVGSNVFQFRVSPTTRQLDQFLTIRGSSSTSFIRGSKSPANDLHILGLDQAITLASSLGIDNPLFVRSEDMGPPNEKNKLLFIRNLYKDKAFALFELYSRFHESLVDIASDWILFVEDILSLFPNFLNGGIQIHNERNKDSNTNGASHNDSAKSGTRNTISKITSSEIKFLRTANGKPPLASDSGNETEKEGLHLLNRSSSSQNLPYGSSDEKVSQTIKKFQKAVNNLIIFLTDQRRINASFQKSSDIQPYLTWKGIEVYPKDVFPDLASLNEITYLKHNASIIDTSLFLCYFYTKPMLLGPLLRLPNNNCDSKVVTNVLLEDLHDHTQQSLRFIRELLDFYFGRALHKEALSTLFNLAHEKPHVEDALDEDIHGPGLTIEYLQKLDNSNLDLVCQYATWVLAEDPAKMIERASLIFMNDSFECENYDTMKVFDYFKNSMRNDDVAIRYLEWLLQESEVLISPEKQRQRAILSTKLCLFYLKKLKEQDEPDEQFSEIEGYKKLEKVLQNSTDYEPWTVLRNIPTTADKFLRLTISIYRRLQEHQKSVDILFNQLDDLQGAIQYCADLFTSGGEENAARELLYKLLEDLLMHSKENAELVAMLLNTQGDKMSVMKVLMALPGSFPMHKIAYFIQQKLTSSDVNAGDRRLRSQLLKLNSTKTQWALLEKQAEYYKVSSGKQPCDECGKALGESVICIDQEDRIVHYKCLQKKRGHLQG